MFSITWNTMIMTTRPCNCRDALISLNGIDLQTMTKCCIVLVILSAFNVLFIAVLKHSTPLELKLKLNNYHNWTCSSNFLEDAAQERLFPNGSLFCFLILRTLTLYLEIHLCLWWISKCILAFLFLETRLRCWVSVNHFSFLEIHNYAMHGHSNDPSNLQARFNKLLSLLSFTSWSSYSSTFLYSFFPLEEILASLLLQGAHFCCDGKKFRNKWTGDPIDSMEVNSIAKE